MIQILKRLSRVSNAKTWKSGAVRLEPLDDHIFSVLHTASDWPKDWTAGLQYPQVSVVYIFCNQEQSMVGMA